MLFENEFPDALQDALKAPEARDGAVLFACRSDLTYDGALGETYLIVTSGRLLVLSPGEGVMHHAIALADITAISIEPLVGASGLSATVNGHPRRLLRFTYAVGQDFSRAVKRLQALIGPGRRDADRIHHLQSREEPGPDLTSRAAHFRTLMRLWTFCLPHWRKLATAVLIMTAGSALDLLPPYLMKILVDDVLRIPSQYDLLLPLVLALTLSRVGHTAVSIIGGRMMSTLGDRLAYDARTELLRALQLLPLKYYDTQQTGGLMARIARDAKSIHYFWIDFAPQVLQQSLLVIGMSVVLFYMNWTLALLVLIPIPVIIVASVKIEKYLAWYYGRSWDRWATFFSQITDALSGIRVVKIFAQEQRQTEQIQAENEKVYQAERSIHIRSRTVRPALAFVVSTGGLLVWWFGGQQVQDGGMSLGTLVMFLGYLAMFYSPVQYLTSMADWVPEMMTAITRTFEVIDSPAEAYAPEGAVAAPRFEGRIELNNVIFGYEPHQPVLQGLNLTIEPGEMIGLVGHSGAGKSTLIKLLCRFYEVDEGHILIDGIDIRQMSLTDLRSQIGYVEQEPFLFAGTVADNIAFGNPDATREAVMEAAIHANAHEFIVKLPDGYDTPVGERGGRLSGGERQRLAIARAILHDPRILILDEPTSALDLETEKKIQEALGRLMQGRTTFAIAHRLSTLRDADRLLVLKQGRPVELGTHEELMALQGEYYRLVQLHTNVSRIVGVMG